MKHKILYFSDCHIYGGSERNIINLMNYLAEGSDLELFFIYRYFKAYQLGVTRDLSKKVRAVPLLLLSNLTLFQRFRQTINSRLLNILIKLPFWLIQKVGIYVLYDYIVLRRAIAKIKPDIIHINNGGYPSSFLCQIAVFAAKHTDVKGIVYHINNPAESQGFFFDKIIDRKINHYTNYFITASKDVKLSLARNRYFSQDKLIQIYNTIETPNIKTSREEINKLYNLNSESFIITEVAFLSRRKGQIYILEAMRKIREEFADIFANMVLFLVGDGEDYQKLNEYCKTHKLTNVIFTGYKDNYADYIACSDLFILPSIGYEDMPLVILMAMSLGKPIIASEVNGIKEEIENHKSGVLIKVEDLANLYLEIIKIIRDNELRNYIATNAVERFNKVFGKSKVYAEVRALYEELLANPNLCSN